jgi:3-isopropylmalate/(R)-2-methylmalate dehydratase small subunit
MKEFTGKALILNRSDINTDEIIPARYLTEITREALGPHLLEDLKIEGFALEEDLNGVSAIIGGANFGCGSSREHAPWALEARGINLVVAPSFARIFRQNMFNCGMLAAEVDISHIEELVDLAKEGPLLLSADIETGVLEYRLDNQSSVPHSIPLKISRFERELIMAGGLVEYADAAY